MDHSLSHGMADLLEVRADAVENLPGLPGEISCEVNTRQDEAGIGHIRRIGCMAVFRHP